MINHTVVRLVIVTICVVIVSGVTTSCANHADIRRAHKHMLVSECPTVKEARNALRGTGHHGVLFALKGLRCSGISPSEEINVALGMRFTRDPSSMKFVLRAGKMTADQVGDSLLATPYRLVDKYCAIAREIDKRRKIVKATIKEPEARNVLVRKLRVNPNYEETVCKSSN